VRLKAILFLVIRQGNDLIELRIYRSHLQVGLHSCQVLIKLLNFSIFSQFDASFFAHPPCSLNFLDFLSFLQLKKIEEQLVCFLLTYQRLPA
jgi:hypothetical protein